MDNKVYEECLKAKKENGRNFWNDLAKKFGGTSESIRSAFRREAEKRKEEKEVETENTDVKILLFDIETTPIAAFVWSVWEQNIYPEQVIEDWHLLCWSAKWLFGDEVFSDKLTSEEATNHNDSRISASINKLLQEADIVVTYNGNKFDIKKLNTRFLINDLLPVSFKSVDLYQVAKNNFGFSSNKLDSINKVLGLDSKSETEFLDWKKAYFGSQESIDKLSLYCNNDVIIMEDLFVKFRPYIRGINLNVYSGESVSICPNCGSENIHWVNKFYPTSTGKFRQFRCLDCKTIGRSRVNELDKEKRKTIVVT